MGPAAHRFCHHPLFESSTPPGFIPALCFILFLPAGDGSSQLARFSSQVWVPSSHPAVLQGFGLAWLMLKATRCPSWCSPWILNCPSSFSAHFPKFLVRGEKGHRQMAGLGMSKGLEQS